MLRRLLLPIFDNSLLHLGNPEPLASEPLGAKFFESMRRERTRSAFVLLSKRLNLRDFYYSR